MIINLSLNCYFSAHERNNAAFELVNLSVTDDDNKFLIVQEGGYVILSLLNSDYLYLL